MYSQANVRAGKWLRPPPRALPSVIVDTEKVLREADGSVKLVVVRPHTGWKGVRPGVRLKEPDGDEPVRSPKNTSVGIGQWSFIGPGSEKKWYPSENSPQGEWDRIAEGYAT